jgi:hypothetical protein
MTKESKTLLEALESARSRIWKEREETIEAADPTMHLVKTYGRKRAISILTDCINDKTVAIAETIANGDQIPPGSGWDLAWWE